MNIAWLQLFFLFHNFITFTILFFKIFNNHSIPITDSISGLNPSWTSNFETSKIIPNIAVYRCTRKGVDKDVIYGCI